MDRYLVPNMLNKDHIRAFGWPVHDPHVLIFPEKPKWAVPCVEEHYLEPAQNYCERCPLTRARDFDWTTVGKLAGSIGPQQWLARPRSERRPISWWMAPHCHLFVAHKHQFIYPLHACGLESDHHCDIVWSGTRQRRHSASSDKSPNHGVTGHSRRRRRCPFVSLRHLAGLWERYHAIKSRRLMVRTEIRCLIRRLNSTLNPGLGWNWL